MLSIYSQQIKTTGTSKIYTHDELPEGERFTDKRSSCRKILDSILAPLRDLSSALQTVPSRISTAFGRNPYPEYCHPQQPKTWQQWKKDSTGLHTFNHGYKGHPSIWDNYVIAVRKIDPKSDIRVPFVPEQGNCSLEKATQPTREMVRAYINEQIETRKEGDVISVNLNGVSNGVRVILNMLDGLVDEELNERLKAKGLRLDIRVNGIAGVVRGTTYWKVRLANTNSYTKKIAQILFKNSPEVLEDFQYQGPASTKLIDTARKINNTSNITFKFAFFASTEDGLVQPHFASLPVLGKGETHHIVHGEGHTSIVDRVMSIILGQR